MLWFKTKKDKRIKELEEEIRNIRSALFGMNFSEQHTAKPQLIKFAERYSVRPWMDAETARNYAEMKLVEAIAKVIKPYVVFHDKDCGIDIDGSQLHEIYARITLVKEGEGEC